MKMKLADLVILLLLARDQVPTALPDTLRTRNFSFSPLQTSIIITIKIRTVIILRILVTCLFRASTASATVPLPPFLRPFRPPLKLRAV